jgi:putative DNA primase/helicase
MKKNNRHFFDKDGHFIPPQLAAHLVETENFLYDRGQLHYFGGKNYLPSADSFIKEKCLEILEDSYRDSRGIEVFRQIETQVKLNSPRLDQDLSWLVLRNGCLDWKTGELIPHNPEIFSSIFIPLDFNPAATCPKIEKFFSEVLPKDATDILYEFFGYCLISDNRFEKALMLLGQGHNGKGTTIRLLRSFLGEKNVSSESLQDLAENRFRMAKLAGRLANAFPDLDTRALKQTGTFKALVSGDAMSAENKFGEPFTFENKARMIFSMNEIPRSADSTYAFYRRLCIIRFSLQLSPETSDPFLFEKLTTEKELSGLLNKALAALRVLMEIGRFSEPISSKSELEKYRSDNETVKVFCEKQCNLNPDYQIKIRDLFAAYLHWSAENDIRPLTTRQFKTGLLQFAKTVSEDMAGPADARFRIWRGINLTKEAQAKFYSEGPESE